MEPITQLSCLARHCTAISLRKPEVVDRPALVEMSFYGMEINDATSRVGRRPGGAPKAQFDGHDNLK